jgi:hypothetical protein
MYICLLFYFMYAIRKQSEPEPNHFCSPEPHFKDDFQEQQENDASKTFFPLFLHIQCKIKKIKILMMAGLRYTDFESSKASFEIN